jgi:hypothetical protein
MTETLEYLEKVLSGLRARFASGDKSVEAKLRAVAAKVDQLKLQNDIPAAPEASTIGKKIRRAFVRRSCCR